MSHIELYYDKGVSYPEGFSSSGMASGIKPKEVKDLALLLSDTPCNWAGTFTKNHFIAAPIKRCQSLSEKAKPIQSLLVNSGNANACTGQKGEEALQQSIQLLSKELQQKEETILSFSTGSIGKTLPINPIQNSLKKLIDSLDPEESASFAESILTTDTKIKQIGAKVTSSQGTFHIGACAKGAGMIEPSMATMLCFITTDALISSPILKQTLNKVVDQTFNKISVDGDQSTNDSVLLLANGKSKVHIDQLSDESGQLFLQALEKICQYLAKTIVLDGEGATKFVEINVIGAKNDLEAEIGARKIANSMLLKCALFGQTPNFGRILSSIGSANIEVNPKTVELKLQGHVCFNQGEPVPYNQESMRKAMEQKDIKIQVDLKTGEGQSHLWGNDLSYEYVTINEN